jgi:hypothetical protein
MKKYSGIILVLGTRDVLSPMRTHTRTHTHTHTHSHTYTRTHTRTHTHTHTHTHTCTHTRTHTHTRTRFSSCYLCSAWILFPLHFPSLTSTHPSYASSRATSPEKPLLISLTRRDISSYITIHFMYLS